VLIVPVKKLFAADRTSMVGHPPAVGNSFTNLLLLALNDFSVERKETAGLTVPVRRLLEISNFETRRVASNSAIADASRLGRGPVRRLLARDISSVLANPASSGGIDPVNLL
jgi:hypothetical protein